MDWLLKHKFVALVIIIVIAGVAWYFLSGSGSSSDVLTDQNAATIPPDAQQLVQSLDQLRSISLDGAIFQNSSFQALQDFTQPVVPEPVGRTNPFAPLSAGEIASGTTTPPAQAPAH